MKSRRRTPEYQDLENQPGLANNASESGSSVSRARSKRRPKRKGRVLQEKHDASSCGATNIEDREVLFDITVEVEDGREVHIQMKEGDSAEQIASRFCEEQNLSSQLILPLTEHIVNNIKHISNVKDDHCRHIDPDYGRQLDEEYMFAKRMADREYRSQKKSKHSSSCKDLIPRRLNDQRSAYRPRKTKQRPFSERLMSFTFSRRRKLEPERQRRKKRKPVILTDKQRALYARLHAEHELSNRRKEQERKMALAMHDRLLKMRKPMFSKKSRRIMKVRELAAQHFENYGELLYKEAIIGIQKKEQLCELRQQELEDSELDGFTGKPMISKLARNLKRQAGKVWDRLQKSKRSESRLQKLREEAAESEVIECTFHPSVNSTAPNIQEISQGTVSRFDLLYWDAESRKKRQEKYMMWFPEGVTFRPTVNQPSLREADSDTEASTRRTVTSRETVFARLLDYAAKLTGRRQRDREEKDQVDPATGQKLFQPVIGRAPSKRNLEGLPVGDFLYKFESLYRSRKEEREHEQLQSWSDLSHHHHPLTKSETLAQKCENRNFEELFRYLDKDKDGYVQLSTAETKDLKDDVVVNIKEAQRLSSEVDKPLPFKTFLDLMLTVQKKRKGLHLMLASWRKKTAAKLTFERKINKKSQALAARKRNFSSSDQWYKIILSDRKRVEEKIQALRRQKELKEVSQCTFKPAILGGSVKSRFKNMNLENLGVEERGEDDVHGYIVKETQLHGPGSQAAEAILAAQSMTDTETEQTTASTGLFSVWKRFVAKTPPPTPPLPPPPPPPPPPSARKLDVKPSVESHSAEPTTFLSGIPEL